jgi:CHAT domain-containing protein
MIRPTESALKLADGKLTLSQIAQIVSPYANFAFLSSCQSAQDSRIHLDEAFHIAAGMQFAGFIGVVGTFWSVQSGFAVAIAEHFYKFLQRNNVQPNMQEAAEALRHAALRIREEGAPLAQWVSWNLIWMSNPDGSCKIHLQPLT